ncbi:MAG: nicotinate-nucleotide--dimethylbenzimidazole phosphoribosyltransferase [Lachnospiraceae bacterium]|nr:nicotinate-nucleotide--dimethylbenzimidazole phosphoribosyltransferase [Lachnospiraceae bacterium]
MDELEIRLNNIINAVGPADSAAAAEAEERQARLAKPPGSLGRLEELSAQLAGITGKIHNELDKKCILVFCADNGVTEEGVASAPQSVTRAQAVNMARGKTGAAVLAKRFGCEMRVIDVGVNAEVSDPAVFDRKIALGTQNIAKQPAMSREQALRAVLCGIETACGAAEEGVKVLGVGEMGIGNTTTSSAVLAVLTGHDAEEVTGRGAGITESAYKNKIAVIKKAIALNAPDKNDVVGVISKVGGLDIAAMAGAFIGAAYSRVPVVIDGFISDVAALCACRLCPDARGYMIPSHRSFERGSDIAAEELGLRPLFDLGMKLGEGSGCPIAMMMLDAACAVMNDMATFEEADIDDSYLDEIRKTDSFSVKGQ